MFNLKHGITVASATLLSLLAINTSYAQVDTTKSNDNNLSSLLAKDDGQPKKIDYTSATFKTTRIANGQSIENAGSGILDFRINHRFGALDGGFKEAFGLDNAVTRIGFDYGLTNRLMIGVGRNTYLKESDAFFKVKIIRQTEDDRMPLSVSYFSSISAQGVKLVNQPAGLNYPFSNRLGFVNQLLIARKFSTKLSLQLMPTIVHNNFVLHAEEPNTIYAIGAGGRLKVSNRIALTAEYYYQAGEKLENSTNSLTLGIDIETGGHVFQLMLSNSTGVSERAVITGTNERWEKGQIHFGFNISRVFTIVKPKGFEDSRNKIW